MFRYRSTILTFLLLSLFSGCQEEVSSIYCKLPARFTFTPVNSISQLYSSCESMGEWCTITLPLNADRFQFQKPNGSTGYANRTALSNYTGFYMGLSGFIVGLPNMPELGRDFPVVTCYDLACSNCYTELHITKPLRLSTDGTAYCISCERTYNLNNTGIVCDGEAGRPLYRYRVYYGNNTLAISN